MTTLTDILDEVRGQIAPPDLGLAELRSRRNCVTAAAKRFPGVLRTYQSGGLAMGVANAPLTDADAGMVLNRQTYTTLGPDGQGTIPNDVVAEIQDFIGPLVRGTYPDATVTKMKRGLIVRCNEPMGSGDDPTVDLVVALNRRDAPGLWIPNMHQQRWDPSNPERHVEMMLTGSASMRRTRARVIRLAKAWNHSLPTPAVCSFNLVALALEFFDGGGDLGTRTVEFFEYAAKELNVALTDDPAGVSGKIKCPNGKETAAKKLAVAAGHLRRALDSEGDDELVRGEVAQVFPNQVDPPPGSKSALASTIRRGAPPALGALGSPAFKPTRAFGS